MRTLSSGGFPMRVRLQPTRALCLAAVLALAIVLAMATAAFAAPTTPDHMSLDELQSMLSASPTSSVQGYFKTVVKDTNPLGSTITTIPCTITAITADSPDDALILFQATGPVIDGFGGIVAGMSGSPVFVNDGSEDKIVGAVSYGDIFTLGGTGLATPIDSMIQIQSDYTPLTVKLLRKPIVTNTGAVINKVVVSSHPLAFAGAAAQGALVANPLKAVYIGGLKPSSRPYQRLASALASRGVDVVSLASRLAAPPLGDQSFETTLEPGASIAALASRGDMWVGGVGTVTYASDDEVLAFGHPAFYFGATSLFMTNAWVDGVWPSSLEPYKLARPGALRGTITQDRSSGIMGELDQFPLETTITAHATDDKGHAPKSSAVYVPRALVNDGTIASDIMASADYIAGAKLFDAATNPGSAEITTTIVVGDGSHVYTVTIPNLVDDPADIPSAVTNDTISAVDELQSVIGDGVQQLDILSVNLDAHFSSHRQHADIVGVTFENSLHVGDNPAKIQVLAYGVAATQTIDATLTIPAGTPLNGAVTVTGLNTGGSQGDFFDYYDVGQPAAPSRTTVADTVDDLNHTAPNNAILLSFQPGTSPVVDSGDGPMAVSNSIDTTVQANWAVDGDARIAAPIISLDPQPTAWYGDTAFISGMVFGPSKPGPVTVYATPAGGVESMVGTTAVTLDGGMPTFELPVDNLLTNTMFRVHVDATDGYTPGDATVNIGVQAMVHLSTSAKSMKKGKAVTLRTSVYPGASAGGRVVFEYNDKPHHWRVIATKTLAPFGGYSKASTSWKVVKGKHAIRSRFLGNAYNVPTASNSVTVTGK